MAAPTVTTQSASGVGRIDATLNGTIVSGASVTKRGFEFNTVQAQPPDGLQTIKEEGSFGTGAFTGSLSGLIPGRKYYYRAWAQNADGIGYGGWANFTTVARSYNVTIDGIDRTGDVINGSIRVEDIINDQINSLKLRLDNRSGNGLPDDNEEIVITLDDGSKMFGGIITNNARGSVKSTGAVQSDLMCSDYTYLLDSNLVHKTYENMTDKAIIEAIVSTYCPGFGITTTNVIEGVTISQISFNYVQPSQAIRKICEMTGRSWYIDYDKDIHYFPSGTDTAPFNIDSDNSQYFDLSISKDNSQLKNRVYVRGGTKLSEFTVYVEVGDGEKTAFVLPDKPHDVTVEVDRGGGYVEETLGIKNVNTEGYKWYLNFQEKYIEQDSGETVLSATDKIRVTYKYDIPILVAIENKASILAYGQREFAIFDKSITTTDAARDRASAELTDYAASLVEGTFKTYEAGFVSGQTININLTDYNVNDDYIVQKVVAQAYGAGEYVYTVSIASAKTMGIIKFLIELLESNKNLIDLDDNEVVDELFNVEDALLSDSLQDALTIDSQGAYFTWCVDSLETTQTRMVWDLFQWM
jgi:hypothetical protein